MKINNKLIALVIMIIILAGAILISKNSNENAIREYSTYTKAFCDENNFCQDYVVICENKEMVSMEKITGASVQFAKDWKDSRENTEALCK